MKYFLKFWLYPQLWNLVIYLQLYLNLLGWWKRVWATQYATLSLTSLDQWQPLPYLSPSLPLALSHSFCHGIDLFCTYGARISNQIRTWSVFQYVMRAHPACQGHWSLIPHGRAEIRCQGGQGKAEYKRSDSDAAASHERIEMQCSNHQNVIT